MFYTMFLHNTVSVYVCVKRRKNNQSQMISLYSKGKFTLSNSKVLLNILGCMGGTMYLC